MKQPVCVYLTSSVAAGGHNWDKGLLVSKDASGVTIQDNEYGLNRRFYPMCLVQRMEYKDNLG